MKNPNKSKVRIKTLEMSFPGECPRAILFVAEREKTGEIAGSVTLPAPPGGKSSIVMRAPEKFEGDEPYNAAKEFEATPTGTP